MIPLVAAQSSEAVAQFERDIAEHHGAAGAVATNSGTSALHLALMALGIGFGDEVIIPSLTCVAVLNAVRQTGAREVLVDNALGPEEMYFNVAFADLHRTMRAYKGSDKAIIVPFMFGVAPDVRAIANLAASFHVPLIEDRAMALGCDAPIYGDLAVHSFHASKIVSCGEGGMVVARTPETLARLRDLNGYSDAVVADRLNDAPEYRQRLNYRMSDVQAYQGLLGLHYLEGLLQRRAQIALHYIHSLGLDIFLPPGSIWGRFVFDLEGRMTPREFVRAMAERGVEAGRGCYPALHQYLRLPGWQLSNAQKATERLAALPLYPGLTDLQVEQVAKAAKEVLGR